MVENYGDYIEDEVIEYSRIRAIAQLFWSDFLIFLDQLINIFKYL